MCVVCSESYVADSGEGYITVEGRVTVSQSLSQAQMGHSGNAGDRNDLKAWHGGVSQYIKLYHEHS